MNIPFVTSDSRTAQERVDPAQFGRELVILAIVFAVATALFAYVVYPLIGWQSTSPMPLRSIALALTILVLLSANGSGLATLGLSRPRRIWLTVILVIGFIALKIFVQQPAVDLIRATWDVPSSDLSFFNHIHGNLAAYIGWLAIAWTAGGFAEEIIFRGYLITRIAGLDGYSKSGWMIAIILQSMIFALGHYYQGMGGMVAIGIGALLSGAVFVLAKRNLWILVFAHGLWDTLGITLIYLNGTPTT